MHKTPFLPRGTVLRQVLRETRFGQFTLAFLGVFLVCSLLVWLTSPNGATFFDGIWFSFQVVSTIGFGDVVTNSFLARIVAMVLSVISIFYIAILTGVVVSFFNQTIRARQKNSLASYIAKLEYLKHNVPHENSEKIAELIEKLKNLEDMTRDELDALSTEMRSSKRS